MKLDSFGLPDEYPPTIETTSPVMCRRCGHAQSRHPLCVERLIAGWDRMRLVGMCGECDEDMVEDIDGDMFVPVGAVERSEREKGGAR